DGFLELLDCSLVPVVAAAQIELIGFAVLRETLRDTLQILAGQSGLQLSRYFTRDVLLNCKNIRKLAIVLLTPELRSAVHIDQFSLYEQIVSSLRNATRAHGANTKLRTRVSGIRLFGLITTHEAACGNAQSQSL